MLFKDGADLLDFVHFTEELHNIGNEYNPDQVEELYKEYDVLRDAYNHNKSLQRHYENHNQGFRDFLKNNCLFKNL